ncbi:hypothetical protein [Caudoviricetes sp.]|nr:hypothetical protein [Caudoviricetes sp.]
MAKKAIVEGEVLVKEGNTTNIEFYTEEFVLDDVVDSLEEARRLIKKALISDRLQRTVKNFKRVRTCQVIEFGGTTEKAENSELDQLMLQAVELDCVPENIGSYKRTDYKIKALQKAIESKIARNAEKKTAKGNETDLGMVD